jgi:hypothetical protein
MLLYYNGKRESSDRTKLKWLNYTLEKKKKRNTMVRLDFP